MWFAFGFFVAMAFMPVPTAKVFPDYWPIITLVECIISGVVFHYTLKDQDE